MLMEGVSAVESWRTNRRSPSFLCDENNVKQMRRKSEKNSSASRKGRKCLGDVVRDRGAGGWRRAVQEMRWDSCERERC